MKPVLRKPAVTGVLHKTFPEEVLRPVVIESGDSHAQVVRTFLGAVRRAHRNDVILLPPGVYPAPEIHRQVAIRALRPGSVRFEGRAGAPALTISGAFTAWISGITFQSASAESPTVRIKKGSLILSECRIPGGIEVEGTDAHLFLQSSWTGAAPTGVEVKDGATAEIFASTIAGCQVGLNAMSNAKVSLLHARIESSTGTSPAEPGAGVHGEKAALAFSGCFFLRNQLGVHLVECPPVDLIACRFEATELASVMASQSGTIQLHSCTLTEQRSSAYAHVTLENTDAIISACDIDAFSAQPVQTTGGRVTIQEKPVLDEPDIEDPVARVLAEIRAMIGHEDSKPVLENIIHQAYAAVKRREQGLPVLAQKYHLLFEGGEDTGRRAVASLLAGALEKLGVLSAGELREIDLEDLMIGGMGVTQVAQASAGGILMLHAPSDIDRHDSRISFSRARDILQALLSSCSSDTIVIFAGERESVRPIVRSSTESEQMFRAVLRFPPLSPPEMAETFASFSRDHQIPLTTRAAMKILLTVHMLDDRRDRRFASLNGIAKLFEATHKRYLERCSRERNFTLSLEAGDIDSPVDKAVETMLSAQPAFVTECLKCGAENPWLPGLPTPTTCAACGHVWNSRWGVWTGSSYYRRLQTQEEISAAAGLPPLRRRMVPAL